jgi:hypothetical protein
MRWLIQITLVVLVVSGAIGCAKQDTESEDRIPMNRRLPPALDKQMKKGTEKARS